MMNRIASFIKNILPYYVLAVTTLDAVSGSVVAVTEGEKNGLNNCEDDILAYSISGCQELRSAAQNIPDQKYWTELRDQYVRAVGKDKSTIYWSLDDETEERIFKSTLTPHVEVRNTREKGRGIYATASMPKFTKIWDGDAYHAIFATECSFRKFLTSISWVQVCDILQWCYGYGYDDKDHTKIGVGCALDEGSLFNHAKEGVANVGYGDDTTDDCTALWDIEEGEEILQDYDSFDVDLDWFEDLIDEAWGNEVSDMTHWSGVEKAVGGDEL